MLTQGQELLSQELLGYPSYSDFTDFKKIGEGRSGIINNVFWNDGDKFLVLKLLKDNKSFNQIIREIAEDRKKDAIVTVQNSTALEKCASNQRNNRSFGGCEPICIEFDVPLTEVVTTVKKGTQNKSLKSYPWWKAALIISYLKVAISHHKRRWKNEYNKALEYRSKQIRDAVAKRKSVDPVDKYSDNITKKVEKDELNEEFTIVHENPWPSPCSLQMELEASFALANKLLKKLPYKLTLSLVEILAPREQKKNKQKLSRPQNRFILSLKEYIAYTKKWDSVRTKSINTHKTSKEAKKHCYLKLNDCISF
ncbi:26498_t:CDS:2 [Dentiscutata erythropus]|uniref:26498_t:CDS:1 n=1 Tax=Dentiscutata erythropus TaxID=1348616 RepID=A0A9N8V680_9GLOM|nr:26498_t:CDS:2 [Dentiscutata erythropus]